ncbi:MAG: SUMF1/EgtB/PvdO family nonheme iron enzyme [Candidatus Aminicenantes bacterium]|nr:SUMF1/EgtB/PvdO family nonheme iron enzyme [Candidatus Aminicenantes bacterium]
MEKEELKNAVRLIRKALEREAYDEAIKLTDKALQAGKFPGGAAFTKEKLRQIRELDVRIDEAMAAKEFKKAKIFAVQKSGLNPDAKKLTEIPNEIELVKEICDALKKGKDPDELSSIIKSLSAKIAQVSPKFKSHFENDLREAETAIRIVRQLKMALAGEYYERAIKLSEEASRTVKLAESIIFTNEKLGRIQELERKIGETLAARDFTKAKRLADQRVSLNPHAPKLGAIAKKIKLAGKIAEAIRGVMPADELFSMLSGLPPSFIEVSPEFDKYFENTLCTARKKIENEKARLSSIYSTGMKRESAASAWTAIILWESLTIDPSELDNIRKLKHKLMEKEAEWNRRRRKRVLRFTAVGSAILALSIYIALVPLPQYLGKRAIVRKIAFISALTVGKNYGEIPGKAREIFETRKKLNDDEALDKEIFAALSVPFQELERLSIEAEKKGDMNRAIKDTGICVEIFKYSLFLPGNELFAQADTKLKKLVFRKYFIEGQRLYSQEKLEEALKSLLIAKKAVPGEEVDRTIDSVRRKINLRELSNALKQARQKRDIEDFLKALMEIEVLTGKRNSHFAYLKEFASTGRNGGLRIILRGVPFVLVRGGEFLMGCMEADCSGNEDALPRHSVRLNDFWMSETEITVSQYNGSPSSLPVCVNWAEAKKFAYGITREFSIGCDLPTEAQWEYAARSGGKENVFPWGAAAECRFANYRLCGPAPKPVASYPPNALGLFDMAGNVREWCQDIYVENSNPTVDFVRAAVTTMRSVRGGSYGDGANALKTFSRYYLPESQRDNKTGIRLIIEDRVKDKPTVPEVSLIPEKPDGREPGETVAGKSFSSADSSPKTPGIIPVGGEAINKTLDEAPSNAETDIKESVKKGDVTAVEGKGESASRGASPSPAPVLGTDYESGMKYFQNSMVEKAAGNLKGQEENLQKAFEIFKNLALFGSNKALLMHYLTSVYLGKYFYMNDDVELLVEKEYPGYRTIGSIEVIDNTEKAIIREKLNQIAIKLKMDKKKVPTP